MGAFLERVREFPFLYNKGCPDYKDTMLIVNRRTMISAEFGLLFPCAHTVTERGMMPSLAKPQDSSRNFLI